MSSAQGSHNGCDKCAGPLLAWKLFSLHPDGGIGPLFINRHLRLVPGVRYLAESHPTKGFAVRPGWHCSPKPEAPHLKMQLADGRKRIWLQVEIRDYVPLVRPASQGGTWWLAEELVIVENQPALKGPRKSGDPWKVSK